MIKIKNYDVEGQINKKIVVLADIHYYDQKDMKKLNKIRDKVKDINPDYICIPGDLTDEAFIYDEDLLIKFLKGLSSICKVIISIGNHELIKTKKHIKANNYELKNKIKKINYKKCSTVT